jgi:hypothetical protein
LIHKRLLGIRHPSPDFGQYADIPCVCLVENFHQVTITRGIVGNAGQDGLGLRQLVLEVVQGCRDGIETLVLRQPLRLAQTRAGELQIHPGALDRPAGLALLRLFIGGFERVQRVIGQCALRGGHGQAGAAGEDQKDDQQNER